MSGTLTPTDVELDFESLTIDDHDRKLEQEKVIIQGGDEDELERFRREWRAEVTGKRKTDTKRREVDAGGVRWKEAILQSDQPTRVEPRRQTQTQTQKREEDQEPTSPRSRFQIVNGASPTSPTSPKRHASDVLQRDRSPTKAKAPSSLAASRSPDAGPSRTKTATSAVQLYAQAVENEQAGQLNDALLLYRRAFKIDGESPPPPSKRRTPPASLANKCVCQTM